MFTIGVDFDNTIASYDRLIYHVALARHLIEPTLDKFKKQIRDTIRQLPNGEIEWQKVQAEIYGPRMQEAELIDGVRNFFELCNHYKLKLYIISHKTEYANYDTHKVNLRTAAMKWMSNNGFFDGNGIPLSPERIFFESTREKKIQRIQQLKCTHFIDDLEETFLEDSFPINVEKLLFAPHGQRSSLSSDNVFDSWEKINNHLFKSKT